MSITCSFDLCNEAITPMWKGLNETGLIRLVPQSVAEPVDGLVQAAFEVDEGIVRPQSLCELVPCHHLARALQQQHQHLERLLLQLHSQAMAAQLAGLSIHF